MRQIYNTPYFLWAILSIPALLMLLSLSNNPGDFEALLHPTGEFSARFLIITLAITPLRMLFPRSGFIRWLMKNRRYFGVASFSYAALHTLFYIVDMGSLSAVMGEFWLLGIWTGWLAFFIFIPLALTSTNSAIRRLGSRWKQLQRLVYIAAIATLIHWIFVHNNLGPALAHFVPLAALEAYRIYRNFNRQHVQL